MAISSRGRVLEIQRMSTEDGPGLRSTAFLKGCPLSCAWCHNPESIDPRPEAQWTEQRCIASVATLGDAAAGCGACLRACPAGALSRDGEGRVVIDRALCAKSLAPTKVAFQCGCQGVCADACPGGAMEILGRSMRARDLAGELLKDRAFFRGSDRGGVTLSGGEASSQAAFSREVLGLCREAGVHTALDTCGVAPWEELSAILPEVDLVLYDLKEAEPERHRRFTGLDNDLVFRNLEKLAALMRLGPMPAALWIRTPVIPGATDREENLFALGARIAALAPPRLERWELCAFNNLCADKYRRLGREWAYAATPLLSAEDMADLAEAARRGSGGFVDVSWTGSVRTGTERKQG